MGFLVLRLQPYAGQTDVSCALHNAACSADGIDQS